MRPNHKRRRLSLRILISLLACPLLLTSCLNPVQLNQRAIVQAVGIDLEDDGQIKLTLQVFSPATSGGGSISATADNAKTIESRGSTVSEAVQNATLVQGKQLFVGHNRIIIIGSRLAEKGLEQPLSYFSANPWSRQNVHLAVAEEKAGDILKARINQGMLPAETLEKIVENTEENGMIKSVKLFEFLKALENEHESSILPVMRVQKEGGGQSGASGEENGSGAGDAPAAGESRELDEVSSISIVGTAVFSDAKMVGTLDKAGSRGLLWIRNDVHNTILTAATDKYETAALRIYQSKSELVPAVEDNTICFTLKIHCEAALGESMVRPGQQIAMADVEALAHAAEALIDGECQQAFQQAARKYGADIFNFGNLVWQKNTDLWRTLKDDWQSHLSEVHFRTEVKVELDRVGLEFKDTERSGEENANMDPSSKSEGTPAGKN